MATTAQRLTALEADVRDLKAWKTAHLNGHVLSGHTHPHTHPEYAPASHTHSSTPPPDPEPIPPPTGDWFGLADPWAGKTFLQKPETTQAHMRIGGRDFGGGVIVENLRWTNKPRGTNGSIFLEGCRNGVIRDIDFDTVPQGIVLYDCHNITIERVRARNIFGPFVRNDPVLNPGSTIHQGNLFEFRGCWDIKVRDVKGLQLPYPASPYGNEYGTEDYIAIGASGANKVWGSNTMGGYVLERFALDGGGWWAHSGTGIFVGDGDAIADHGGKNVWFRDFTLLNPGQCGIGTGEDGTYRFERGKVYSMRINRGANVVGGLAYSRDGIQSRANENAFGSMQVDWTTGNGTKSGLKLGSQYENVTGIVDLGGNNFNATIDPATLKVVL